MAIINQSPAYLNCKLLNPVMNSILLTQDDEEDLNESNYDEFNGYGGSLFNKDP